VTILFSACSHNKNKLSILFERVDHLEVGAQVYLKNIPIGKVTNLDLFDKGVIADISLKDKTQIPVDSKFLISTSILSTTSIIVESSDKKIYLTDKDTVAGQYDERKLLDLMIIDSTKRQKIQQSFNKIGEGVKEIIETASDTSHKTKN
jgi:ABC-type transporter Mla subunit MlaD